ncbi:MAG: response regulator transcription factor [Phycisphaerae bacterium]|nr:response regulator transcription factor [Phycisphaerae bacterium]
MSKKRIIIIEDERDMAELVAMRLKREGYDVEMAHDGLDGLRAVQASPPDLVLLDLMLPGMPGVEVAKEIRNDPRTSGLPVIMLTAKGEESDIVVGLHVGADDYMTKPFSMSVLVARIAAVLRRSRDFGSPGGKVLKAGPIQIDADRHLVEVDGADVSLTLTEFRLLVAIISARGRVLDRNQLIDQALGMDAIVTDRTIDVHLTALRKKLGDARKYIQTVRGLGYRLADENETS